MAGVITQLYTKLEKHVLSPAAYTISFIWGFAEATLFFIIPDVYIGFAALMNWKRGLQSVFVTVLGAITGGTVMYLIAINNGPALERTLDMVPLISAEMIQGVYDQVANERFIAFLKGPLAGIPYKIYATQAGQQGLPYLGVVFYTIFARLERFLPMAIGAGVFGHFLKGWVQSKTKWVMTIYILMWVGIYTAYYMQFR